MSKTTLAFLFSGMGYLSIGVTLGVLFFIVPDMARLRTVHAHLNLVGFVIFAIMGIGYHILPRFRGRPLHSERLAWSGFWLANVGLAGMLLVNSLRAYAVVGDVWQWQALFGGLLALAIYLFVYNMFRTLAGAPKPARPAAPPAKQ
ncbi:MAG: cbb3-type cytochrome c oxidase subunit I [Chloroflexi bacterium]|nr:cbb3-type cytochrome c oxidase subunit I [Chloroflexota bacterium]